MKKQVGNLAAKPQLTQGLASHEEERKLELSYVQLQDLEENSKKLYKEVKKYEECLTGLQRQEEKVGVIFKTQSSLTPSQVASDLSNSTVCQENPELRRLAEEYSSAVYQLGNTTDDLSVLSQKTVVDPMKKLVGEFPCIQAAVKRRDLVLQVIR